MSEFDIESTTAYRIVDQIMSHSWPGVEWDAHDLVGMYRLFTSHGGSWEAIVRGSADMFTKLEDAIANYLNYRDVLEVAKRMAVAETDYYILGHKS